MRVSVLWLSILVLAGCGEGRPSAPTPINLEEEQNKYDQWVDNRIKAIESDSKLSDDEKKKKIEEVKASAQGQMGAMKELAGEQGAQDTRDSAQENR